MTILSIVAAVVSFFVIIKFRSISEQPRRELRQRLKTDQIQGLLARKLVNAALDGFLLTTALSIISLLCLVPISAVSTLWIFACSMLFNYEFEQSV